MVRRRARPPPRGCGGATTTRRPSSRTTALVEENRRRGRTDREFELVDTGVFDGDALLADRRRLRQGGIRRHVPAPPDPQRRARPAELHALPTLWFRNRWSWDAGSARPSIRGQRSSAGTALAIAEDVDRSRWLLAADPHPGGRPPTLLFCENETNYPRLFGSHGTTPYPKDGINDHVVHGAATVNPEGHGTKMSCWYRVAVDPGDTIELRLRLASTHDPAMPRPDLGTSFVQTMGDREREADEFYASLRPTGATDDEAAIMRQALGGDRVEPAILRIRRAALARR